MTHGTWSFFDPETGNVDGRQYTGPARHLEDNTPPGLIPFPGATPDGLWRRTGDGTLVSRAPPAEPTEWVEARARAVRARLLAASDWVVLRATDRGESVPAAWADYRQALRDAPQQHGWPLNIVWPSPPN